MWPHAVTEALHVRSRELLHPIQRPGAQHVAIGHPSRELQAGAGVDAQHRQAPLIVLQAGGGR